MSVALLLALVFSFVVVPLALKGERELRERERKAAQR
jgi:hypothetical protein